MPRASGGVSRRDAALVLPMAPALVIWLAGVVPMSREESAGWWTLALVWVVAVVPVLCAGGVLAIVLALHGSAAHSRAVVAAALACGMVAATPVNVSWNDGCNDHGGRVALVALPYVQVAAPAELRVPYTDTQTLMFCG